MSDEKKLPDEELDKVSGGVGSPTHQHEELGVRDRATSGGIDPHPDRPTNPRLDPP